MPGGEGPHIRPKTILAGSDGDTTQGSEPTHARSPTDVNFDRGYEVWLMEQAVQRRPGMQLSGLEWGVPGWVGAGHSSAERGFFSDVAVDYLTGWAKGLRDEKGLNLTALGVARPEQNLRPALCGAHS